MEAQRTSGKLRRGVNFAAMSTQALADHIELGLRASSQTFYVLTRRDGMKVSKFSCVPQSLLCPKVSSMKGASHATARANKSG